MSMCECLNGRLFFNDKMADLPKTSALYKEVYCMGDNSTYTRYTVLKSFGRSRICTRMKRTER